MKNIAGKLDKKTLCWRDHEIKKKMFSETFHIKLLKNSFT